MSYVSRQKSAASGVSKASRRSKKSVGKRSKKSLIESGKKELQDLQNNIKERLDD